MDDPKPPLLDPSTQYIGITKLRYLNRRQLRNIQHPLLVTAGSGEDPLAVIFPYRRYCDVQRVLLMAYGAGLM